MILYVYLGLMVFVQKDIQALIHLHIENYITQWQLFHLQYLLTIQL